MTAGRVEAQRAKKEGRYYGKDQADRERSDLVDNISLEGEKPAML